MTVNNKQLKDFIIDSGLVSRADLDNAEKSAHREEQYLGDILVSSGKLSEDELRRTEAYLLGIPYVNLKDREIELEVLSIIPESIARKHNIVAVEKNEKGIVVAMLNVDDFSAVEFITDKLGIKFLPRLTDNSSLRGALYQYQRKLKEKFGDIIEREGALLKTTRAELDVLNEEETTSLAKKTSAVTIVDTLLSHAILQGASDIHIEPTGKHVIIRYRIGGVLHDAMKLSAGAAFGLMARVKMLASLKMDKKHLLQNGRFPTELLSKEKILISVSVLPVCHGEKMVMRLSRESELGFTLEGLGFYGEGLEKIHRAMGQRRGMIFVAGTKKSGHSTILYTLLDILNTPNVSISTIEDPVEHRMTRVNQTQVRPEIGLTFAKGLRAISEQDPDIVMVSKIRESATASLAMNVGLRGSLVLAPVDSPSASGAVSGLMNMNVEAARVASSIDIIICQRLVRRLSSTREKYFLNDVEIKSLGNVVDLARVMKILQEENIVAQNVTWGDIAFCRTQDSHEGDEGYAGYVGLQEVLKMSPVIREFIIKGASADEIEAQAKIEGMVTMLEDGIIKAVQGMTTIEEVVGQSESRK